jgi:hypothetical protein
MYICMYEYMYECKNVCMYVRVCVYVWMYVCTELLGNVNFVPSSCKFLLVHASKHPVTKIYGAENGGKLPRNF